MKETFHILFGRLLVSLLLVGLSQCKNGSDVAPGGSDGITITDPSELSKVMIIPGATLEKGTPPPVTNTTDTPRLSTSTPEVSAISGQDGTFSINYSNAVGNITIIYIQFEGADSYFKIPISGKSGINGQITIPMRIPENYVVKPAPSGKSSGRFCCFAATANAREVALCNNNFTSNLPPGPGKGTATIGGKSYDATAICDLSIPPYGRGYIIQISQSQFIAFYNMKSGGNSLGNFETLVANSSTGVPSSPFALYFDDSGNLYSSVSGTATTNGKTVSASISMKDIYTGRQVSLSAAGNCQ